MSKSRSTAPAVPGNVAHGASDGGDRTTRVSSGRRPASSRRIEYIHDFRGMAALFIVATHTLSVFDWTSSSELGRVLKYLFANGTLFFLFISGFLFEYLSDDIRLLPYWGKKLKFVVLPYLLVSIPAIWLFAFRMEREGLREGFYQQPGWMRVVELIVTGGHLAPFWFIPTVVCFYLASPVLRALFRRDAAFWLLLPLFLLPYFFDREPNPLLNLVHFLPVWVLGMACCRFRNVVEIMLPRAWLGLTVVVVGLTVLELMTTKGTHSYLGYVQKCAMTLCLLAILIRGRRWASTLFSTLGTLSFGIYFLHSYVISAAKQALKALSLSAPEGNAVSLVVGVAVITLLTTLLVRAVRASLGARSRFVIGV